MFRLGDEFDAVAAWNAMCIQDFFIASQFFPIHNEELVFIELDLFGNGGVYDSDAGAAVFGEKFFVLSQNAPEDRHIDVLTIEILMSVRRPFMTGLKNNVRCFSQRIKEVHEDLKKFSPCDCRHKGGCSAATLFVNVRIMTISLLRDNLQVIGGPNGVGEAEIAVVIDPQVRFQFIFRKSLEGRFCGFFRFAEHAQSVF